MYLSSPGSDQAEQSKEASWSPARCPAGTAVTQHMRVAHQCPWLMWVQFYHRGCQAGMANSQILTYQLLDWKERNRSQTSGLRHGNQYSWWFDGPEEWSSLPMQDAAVHSSAQGQKHTLGVRLLRHPQPGPAGAPLTIGLCPGLPTKSSPDLVLCERKHAAGSVPRVKSKYKMRSWPQKLPWLNHTGKQLRNVAILCLKAADSLEERKIHWEMQFSL